MSSQYPPVAIVGASALFPGSIHKGKFWKNILEGHDLLSEVPETHWLLDDYYDPDPTTPDKTYAQRGGFLPVTEFSPMDFGVPPNIIPATDTAQLLALNVAQRVLEDVAGGDFSNMDRDKISVVLGVASATELVGHMSGRLQQPVWERALRNIGLPEEQVQAFSREVAASYVEWQESTFPGLLGNVVAGRIANRLDLGGTNCVVDAACASSLAALEIGLNELYLGQSDLVIGGGVDTLNDILMFMCFSKTTALSVSGDCRPFSDQADGTMLGEGIGMVALKRLEDAERDGDKIYAVIQGLGSSSDGRAKSIYAPVSEGQAKALRRCYERAGYGPETVELVEAHGTGTKAGDAAEFGGLKMIFEDETDTDQKQWCALGSVKSQVGHTKAAAGSAGLFKVAMALHHRVIPPTIKIDKPNPMIDVDNSPFYLNTTSRPWVRGSKHPRRASVSSFGFGGTNFHVTLEEYKGAGRQWRMRSQPCELFVWSADSASELIASVNEVMNDIDHHDDMFEFFARQSQQDVAAGKALKLAVVANNSDDLKKKLKLVHAHLERSPTSNYSTPNGIQYAHGGDAGKVAFLFPGQGSQYVNMGNQLAIHFERVLGVWDRTADMTFDENYALHDVVFPRTPWSEAETQRQREQITATEWAQPAIGAASLGVRTLLDAMGVRADVVAGHSFGELTALYHAGVYSEEDFLRIARKRGELMAAASDLDGAMTAVVSDVDTVVARLEEWGVDVVIANHNSPSQVVLSGATSAIEQVEERLAEAGMKYKRLKVATAFHSPLVSDSSAPLKSFLDDVAFSAPNLAVYANSTADVYPEDADQMRALLAGQVAQPVRFVEQLQAMYDAGVRTFIEVGPEAVLSNLVTRTLKGDDLNVIATDRRGKHSVEMFTLALAQMFTAGLELDFSLLWEGYKELDDPRQRKASRFAVELGGANYGKPSPFREPTAEAAAAAASINEPRVVEKIVEVEVERIVEVPVPVANGQAHTPAHTPAPAPAPAPVAAAPVVDGSWLDTFERMQEETARAQAEYQRMMAESHTAFLDMAQATLANLSGSPASKPAAADDVVGKMTFPNFAASTNGHHINGNGVGSARAEAGASFAAPSYSAPVSRPAPAMEMRAPVSAPPVSAPVASKPAAPVAKAPAPAPAAPVAKPAPAAPAKPGVDLTAVMLSVVAEKTGYPEEMLDLSMELEADLGIDSIKRVEILSSMQESIPGLPEVETSAMAQLTTLQQIVDYIAELGGAALAGSPASAPAAAPVASAAPAAAPAAGIDLTKIMLEIVAEKTGYPEEMLDLSMELEADLGIDSIKRVEILSSMQERVPGLPEVETSAMAQLTTLQEIVDYIAELGGAALAAATTAQPAASAPAAPVTASQPATSAVDLVPVMLSVVAEKTGYPEEMLDLSMELEADLGIDSIKRVEILSSMQERVPGLPEVETSAMAQLVTLQQIVDYLAELGGGAIAAPQQAAPTAQASQAAPKAQPAAASSAAAVDLTPVMLEIVAEKTGYPAEMLDLSMELEADLGIDSIKRVEILSSMQERVPGLPEVETSAMAQLVTLQQIVDYMQGVAGDAAPSAAQPATQPAAPSGPSNDELVSIMLAIVAEKTGYPAEMLDLSMELEADLGIDSIKRVEILSAMQERVPGLPEVETSAMAQLVTLQQIVEHMSGAATQAKPSIAKTMPSAPSMREQAEETYTFVGEEKFEVGLGEVSDVRLEVSRYVTQLVEAPASGLALPGLESARNVEIISDGTGLAQALAVKLGAFGPQCFVVQSAQDLTGEADVVIALGGMSQEVDFEKAVTINREAFHAACRMAPRFSERQGVFVTVQDTGGKLGLDGAGERAWMAGLTGLIKTANKEWPSTSVRAIDLERGNRPAGDLAQAIVNELWNGGAELEVGLTIDGGRWSLASYPRPTSMSGRVLNKHSVVVVSGGARGVTAASIIELARQTRATFVLLGRTAVADAEPAIFHGKETEAELKRAALEEAKQSGEKVTPRDLARRVRRIQADREVRATLAALEEAGARAKYASVDVRDTDALSALFDEVREEFGAITALVHGAGVLADALLSSKTLENFDLVFGTKVEGLRAMLDALSGEELEALCMFSSVAGRTGNVGQSDYAMANEVLNRVASAYAARFPNCVVKSLGWGPWDGGMVSPQLKAMFEQRGVELIDLDAGARAFAAEMLEEESEACEVVLGGGVVAGGLNSLLPEPGQEALVRHAFTNATKHPFLADHCIQGKVVLPVVQGMEWFVRMARSANPGTEQVKIKNLKVLKGVALSGYEDAGDAFIINAELGAGGKSIDMKLIDAKGTPRYQASAESIDWKRAPLDFAGLTGDLAPAPWAPEDFYGDDTLFHGEAFQVLRSIEGVGEQGARATLVGLKSKGWSEDFWATDAALIDGCLQLALLWGLEVSGGQSLPMRIAEFVQYGPLPEGEVTCELVKRSASSQRTISDIRVYDAQGAPLLDLRGVEMYVVPGGTARGN
jgi:polyketide-type polyunsaturated fatty acid synthase PfaA